MAGCGGGRVVVVRSIAWGVGARSGSWRIPWGIAAVGGVVLEEEAVAEVAGVGGI